MPFGVVGRMGPRNGTLYGGLYPDVKGAILTEMGTWRNVTCTLYVECGISHAKMAEPIELLFGMVSGAAKGIVYQMGVQIGAT